jgi:hypothetical protein
MHTAPETAEVIAANPILNAIAEIMDLRPGIIAPLMTVFTALGPSAASQALARL